MTIGIIEDDTITSGTPKQHCKRRLSRPYPYIQNEALTTVQAVRAFFSLTGLPDGNGLACYKRSGKRQRYRPFS